MDKKILIVDDERFIWILLEETLGRFKELGVKILTAQDGSEALKLAAAESPNLILLDIMMPRLDGYEVCRRIREEIGLRDAHIIMLTAKGRSGDKLWGLQMGANEYLTKPFDPDYLVSRAAEILGISL